ANHSLSAFRVLIPAFAALLSVRREYVARLALKRPAHLLQSVEVNSERLALFQTPQRCVADAGLFGQPIERPPLSGQQFIYSNFNHVDCRSVSLSIYYV